MGYFANKDQKEKEKVERTKKSMKSDKRIILELQRQIKALNI